MHYIKYSISRENEIKKKRVFKTYTKIHAEVDSLKVIKEINSGNLLAK